MGLLSACVGNKPYRLGGIADEFYPNQKPGFEQAAVSSGRNYRLSFVEFDERGDFWDRRQLAAASRAIRKSNKPVLLVTFIHGWHNNADSGDVETFRCVLSELAVSESLSGLSNPRCFPRMAWAACRGVARLHYFPQSEGSCDASRRHASYRNNLRADQAGSESAPRSLKVRRDRAFIRRACSRESDGASDRRRRSRSRRSKWWRIFRCSSRPNSLGQFGRRVDLRKGTERYVCTHWAPGFH